MKTSSITLHSEEPQSKDWGFEHLKQLKGAVCVDIARNTDTGHNSDEEYGLVFRTKSGKIKTAWIMCDPEGNGAGHLDIV
jgi:hypothetical protein